MRRNAFTLIELLVVIVIIGILVALLMPVLLGQMRKAKIAAANSTISSLKTALVAYNGDNGEFPADQCKNYTDDVAAATMTFLRQLRTQGTNFPYFDPRAKDTKDAGGNDELLLDPWRKPFVYVLAPQRRGLTAYSTFPGNVGGFNLFSLGPNKRCESCAAFTGDAHDTSAAASGATSQKHIGGTSAANSDDPRNW